MSTDTDTTTHTTEGTDPGLDDATAATPPASTAPGGEAKGGAGKPRTPNARSIARSKLAARREEARKRDKRIEDSLTTLLSNASSIDLVAYTRDAAIAAAHEEFERASAGIRAEMATAVVTLRGEGLTLDEIADEAELPATQVRELNKLARDAAPRSAGDSGDAANSSTEGA